MTTYLMLTREQVERQPLDHFGAKRLMVSHVATLDALDAALEALTDIAEERYPENSPLRLEFYDLEGDHEFDARHAYPCRIQWLTDQARAALAFLAAVATPQGREVSGD